VAAGAGPALKDLHREFSDRVDFVTLYVREAHPGEHVDQPQDAKTKMQHARAYQERDGIPWPVVVDDLDGSLHRRLGPADTGYAVGADGLVAARTLWAADARAVQDALAAAAAGDTIDERRTRVLPIVVGASELKRIFDLAGPRAWRDAVRVMPPVYLAGRIAGRLPPWSPLTRGAVASAATAAALLGVSVAIAGVWTLVRAMSVRPALRSTRRR
jgi:hypothetical protein